ncbi:MAG: rhomboid family intramembrane serine protease [Candidatus Bruticola sp.]
MPTTNNESNNKSAAELKSSSALPPATEIADKKSGRLCPRCKGNGICLDCGGSGETACPDCNGSGISGYTSQGKPLPCRTCKGKKAIPCSKVCESCGGSGIITSSFQQKILEKYQSPSSLAAHHSPKAVYAIIIVCLVVYAAQFLWPMQFQIMIAPWLSPYMPSFAPTEIWRLLTAAFLHGGLFHLLCNMYCLYVVGLDLEEMMGSQKFIFLFACGCIIGNLFSSFLNPVGGIGASTGIFALLSAYWAYHKRWALGSSAKATAYIQGVILLLFMGFCLSFLTEMSFLDNWGHLGGAAGGLMYVKLTKRPI